MVATAGPHPRRGSVPVSTIVGGTGQDAFGRNAGCPARHGPDGPADTTPAGRPRLQGSDRRTRPNRHAPPAGQPRGRLPPSWRRRRFHEPVCGERGHSRPTPPLVIRCSWNRLSWEIERNPSDAPERSDHRIYGGRFLPCPRPIHQSSPRTPPGHRTGAGGSDYRNTGSEARAATAREYFASYASETVSTLGSAPGPDSGGRPYSSPSRSFDPVRIRESTCRT